MSKYRKIIVVWSQFHESWCMHFPKGQGVIFVDSLDEAFDLYMKHYSDNDLEIRSNHP